MKRWQEVLGKSSLRYLDVSNNALYDEGAICLIKSLLDGPLISTDPLHKKDPSTWVRKDPKLRTLLMRNVSMGDAAGMVLSQLIAHNRKFKKIAIEGNTINFKYIEEVNAACAKNREAQKKKVVPKFMQELN